MADRHEPQAASQQSDLPHRTEEEQRAFFADVLARSLEAEEKAGAVEHWFELAGSVLRVVFAGAAMAECFVPALAHLEIAPASRADAMFHVWDSGSTQVRMSPPIFTHKCFTHRGDIWTMGSKRFRSAYLWGEFTLQLFDVETATGLYWTHAASALPYWAKAAPMRPLLHWWMETRGCQLMHGAAVGSGGEAVLITGRGGLGKSTTSIAALSAGFDFLGDDYVVVQPDPEPRVHSLYATAKLGWEQMARFPRFAPLIGNRDGAGDEKAVLYLHPAMAKQIVKSLPLKAILTPRIAQQVTSELERISKTMLQRAAAFTTMAQLPHASRWTQELLNNLVDRLPGFQIALGSDLDAVAAALRDLLARPAAELVAMAEKVEATVRPDQPLVSVVIPVHNGARFIAESVGSILRQDYRALEIIVVDDGSSDGLEEAVSRLPVDVRYLKQENAGPAAARNRGIRNASGELLAFLDVDDLWPEHNLQTLVELMTADPDREILQGFAQLMQVAADGGKYEFIGNPGESFPDSVAAGLFRREVFEKVGLFDEGLWFGEDRDWFNRARERGLNILRVEQVTLLVRRHDANMTRGKTGLELNELRVMKKVLDRRRQAMAAPKTSSDAT
jgi:hypothetical protein